MKRILLVMTFLLFLIGCETIVSKISIEVDDSTVPEFIYIGDEYDITNIKVKVKYSDDFEETISLSESMIDASDLLKLSKVGTHVITVIDKGLSDTFSITVKEKENKSVLISLTITGKSTVYELSQITLTVSVSPVGSSSEVIWTSVNPEIATVDQNGVVSALKPGFADIKAQLKSDPSVEKAHRIEVLKLNIALPNFNNYEITIMVNEQLLGEHDPYSDRYFYLDKEYKKAAWEEIQNFYNVRLTVKPLPIDTPPFGTQRVNWLIQKAKANESPADIMVNHTDWLPQLGLNEAVVDVSSYYEAYGRPMAKGIKDSGTYKDGLYILPNYNIGKVIVDDGLFFNVNLLESLQLENPAKLFNDGLWTYSKFREYVENAASKLNTDQSVLSGKPAYLYMGMANAAGVKLVDTVELTVNFEDSNAVEAVTILQDLYKMPKVWGSNAYEIGNDSFNNGKSIFQVAEYGYLKNSSKFHENMWGEGSTRYGYVPFPYPDSMTKEQTKIIYEGGLVYQMVKGRTYTDGIKEADIFEVFTRMMNLTKDKFNAEFDPNEYMAAIYNAKLDDEESRKAISYFTDENLIFEGFALVAPIWSYGGPMIDEVVVEGKDYFTVLDDYEFDKDVIIGKIKEIYG